MSESPELTVESNGRRKRIAQNALTLVAAILAGFSFAEVTLRFTGYEGDHERKLFKFTAPYSTVRRDSWALKENQPDECQTPLTCKISIGREQVALNAQEQKRILFLGDSVTEGYGVDPAHAFVAQFGAMLANKSNASLRQGSRVINAGVYGFNTFDEYKLYAEKLRDLEADTVVLGLFPANDINFNLLSSERLRNHPAFLEKVWFQAEENSAVLHFGYLSLLAMNHRLRFSTENSAGAYWSRMALIEKESGLHMLHYREGEIAQYRRQESTLMRHAYELLERILIMFQTESKRRNARFLVLILPSPATVQGTYYSPIEPNILQTMKARGIQIESSELDVDLPRLRIKGLCERHQLQCIDATARLRLIGKKAFLPDDDHLSDAGHSAVAVLLKESLTDF